MRTLAKRRKRILVLGDYRCDTGFGVVLTNILKQVRKYYGLSIHLDIVAGNWYGDRLADDYDIKPSEAGEIKVVEEMVDDVLTKIKKRIRVNEGENVVVYSAYYTDGKKDYYGRNAFLSFLKQIDYDLVFIIQDLGTVTPIFEVIRHIKDLKKKEKKKLFKTIFYFPVDGAIVPGWFKDFDAIDRPVAYTEYAKKEVKSVRPDLKLQVILHGVDTSIFGPIDDIHVIREFREVFFGENAGKTIISNINRNQHRKDIPTTIFAFKHYKEHYNKNCFLYLHMDPEDLQGWNLRVIMEQTGLVQYEDYMFMSPEQIKEKPDQGFLNALYQASDVVVTSTTGEGFGNTIIEPMMARVPVVAPYHTSIMELSGNDRYETDSRMWNVDNFRPYVSRFDNMIRQQCNPEELAETINAALQNPEWAAKKMDAAYDFARSLSWHRIGKQWIDLFKQLL